MSLGKHALALVGIGSCLGVAIFACVPPPAACDQTDCDGSCVDLETEFAHCGACGHECRDAERCSEGKCVPDCSDDLSTDPANCGACGNACPSSWRCAGGQCQLPCDAPRTVCFGVGANGEITAACSDTATDPQNCGTCKNECADGVSCVGGKCGGAPPPVDAGVDAGPQCAPGVVVADVYTGNGDLLQNDYVVLKNRNASAASLAGWSLQISNASDTSNPWTVVALSGSIPANGYWLVKLGGGSDAGAGLPTADATAASIDLQEGGVRVAVVSSTTALAGNATTGWVDAMTYGDALATEGDPVFPNASQSLARKGNGCTDTNATSNDFQGVTPAPKNSASAAVACTCP